VGRRKEAEGRGKHNEPRGIRGSEEGGVGARVGEEVCSRHFRTHCYYPCLFSDVFSDDGLTFVLAQVE
jgi:hypothetical protein